MKCLYDCSIETADNRIVMVLNLIDFRVYDRAAIKFRGLDADINFNVSDYHDELKQVC